MLKEISIEECYKNIKNANIDTCEEEYEYINNSLDNIQYPRTYIENQCSFDEIKDIIQKSIEIQFCIANFVRNEILEPELTEDIYKILLTDNLLKNIARLYRDVYITKSHIYFYNLKYEAKIVFLNLWQNKLLNKWVMYYILDGNCDSAVNKKVEFYELKQNNEKANTTEQESFVAWIETLRRVGLYSIPINRHICEIEKDKNLQIVANIYNIRLIINNKGHLSRPELVIGYNE